MAASPHYGIESTGKFSFEGYCLCDNNKEVSLKFTNFDFDGIPPPIEDLVIYPKLIKEPESDDTVYEGAFIKAITNDGAVGDNADFDFTVVWEYNSDLASSLYYYRKDDFPFIYIFRVEYELDFCNKSTGLVETFVPPEPLIFTLELSLEFLSAPDNYKPKVTISVTPAVDTTYTF